MTRARELSTGELVIKITKKQITEITLASLLLIGFMLWWASQRSKSRTIRTTLIARHGEVRKIAPEKKTRPDISFTQAIAKTTAPKPLPTPVHSEEKSADEKEKFFKEAKIRMKLPRELRFERFDFEDGTAMLTSVNRHTKMGLTVFAAKGDFSPQSAIAFFQSDLFGSLPATKGTKLTSLSDRTVFGPIQNSGMLEASRWEGRLSDRNDIHVVTFRRQDGRGTYMLIFTGSEKMFSENEGFFEQMYLEIKALP